MIDMKTMEQFRAATIVATLAASVVLISATAGPATAQQAAGLELPEDLQESAQRAAEEPTYTVEERRIGNRLERVTIRRSNGLDEIYENTEVDSMWLTEDKELGQTQNVRRWTIGSW